MQDSPAQLNKIAHQLKSNHMWRTKGKVKGQKKRVGWESTPPIKCSIGGLGIDGEGCLLCSMTTQGVIPVFPDKG